MVNFGLTFQSSCAKNAHASLCDEMKFVVEICPRFTRPSMKDAYPSPVFARRLFDVGREGGVRAIERKVPKAARYLKERELDRPVFGAELVCVSAFVDGNVLDEVPDVVVFNRRKPARSAETAVPIDMRSFGRPPPLRIVGL